MVEYRPLVVRDRARDFLRAIRPSAASIWRSMPRGWTPASHIASDLPQSTVSSALADLRRAGAVESRRRGRHVDYRPNDTVVLHVQVHRDVGCDDGGPP